MACLYFIYVAFVEVSAWNSILYKLAICIYGQWFELLNSQQENSIHT